MTTVSVGGLTWANDPGFLDAAGNVWTFSDIPGWFDGPGVRGEHTDHPTSHGAFAQDALRDGRLIVLEGFVACVSRAEASRVQKALTGLLAEGGFDALTVADPDQDTLASQVQLGGKPQVPWESGTTVEHQLTFYAPDPLRYAPAVSVSTSLPVLAGGLEFDLLTDGTSDTGFLEFGASSSTGRVVVSNPGTAEGSPIFVVTGPVPDFALQEVASGSRIEYSELIPVGSVVTIDSGTGDVTLDGADRSGKVVRAEWMPVPPGGSSEWAFSSTGTDPGASLSVTLRPPSW